MKFLHHTDLLCYEELLRVVRLAVPMGMNKLRLTGGEPLVRKGVLDFIHQLSLLDGLDQLQLTTNGVLLEEYAETLFAEGVHQINVSLDIQSIKVTVLNKPHRHTLQQDSMVKERASCCGKMSRIGG